MQVNRSERDPELIQIRWQCVDKHAALRDFERIDRAMPDGHTEELSSYRRRKNKGQRRSCTVHIRHTDSRVPGMVVEDAIQVFGFLAFGGEVIRKAV